MNKLTKVFLAMALVGLLFTLRGYPAQGAGPVEDPNDPNEGWVCALPGCSPADYLPFHMTSVVVPFSGQWAEPKYFHLIAADGSWAHLTANCSGQEWNGYTATFTDPDGIARSGDETADLTGSGAVLVSLEANRHSFYTTDRACYFSTPGTPTDPALTTETVILLPFLVNP
jgi:hypothetical protein